jgi:hypothetical protein
MMVYVSFKLNQDFISKTLCINRAKPKLHCNGKCQLMKKLKQVEKEEQKQLPQGLKEKLEVIYIQEITNFKFSTDFDATEEKLKYNHTNSQVYSKYHLDIFHPPQLRLI